MLMADVFGSCNDFIEYGGWNFTYRTEFMNNSMVLNINVKYPMNSLTTQGEDKNECVVCNENTNDLIICCKQPVCKKKCLKDIQKHQPDNFCCPMCRKNLDTYTKKFTLTKEDVRKRCTATI